MKEKIKRISSSTWALILALMMAVSSFSVLAATTNVNKSGTGASGGTISEDDILYYDFSSITTAGVNYSDGQDVRYAGSFSGTCTNGRWLDNKVLAVDVQKDITFKSDSSQVIVKTLQAGWNTELKATQIPEDGQNCIKVSISADNSSLSYTWTTYGGGSTTGDTVYIYGTCNSTTCNKWADFDKGTETPKFTYDADNHKYYLNDFLMENNESYFRIYNANTKIHYMGTAGDTTTLTSGVASGMKEYTKWSTDNYRFKYAGARGKKVNIEIPDNFSTIKVTEVQTTIADSVSLKLNNATDDKIDYGTNLSVTAKLSNKNSNVDKVDYKFYLDDSTSPLQTTSSADSTCDYTIPASKLTAGNHTVKVEVSADGYDTLTDTKSVTVNAQKFNVETGVKLSTDGATYTVSSDYAAPTGGGSVTSTTLTASDIDGYTFVGWETSNSDSITSKDTSVEYKPTSNVTVYAKYNKNYTITINTVENGTVKVDNATTSKTVTAGTEVVFTATANEGYQFTAWTGALTVETESTVKKTVTNNMNVGATFSKASYTITKADTSNGSFTVTSDSGAEITSANYGDTVTVTPTPADGYKLDSVKYNDTTISANDGKYSFTMPAGNVTVSVTFKSVPTYTIYGSIINSAWTVGTGKQMTYDSVTGNYYYVVKDVNADSGRHFRLFSNNKDYGPDGEIDIKIKTTPTKMGSADKKKAYYINETALESGHVYTIYTDGQSVWYTDTQNKHNITVDKTTKNGSVTATPNTEAGAGATVTLTNTPEQGYTLDSYKVYKTGDESTTVNVTDGTFTMPDYDVTVTATFKKIDYTMTVSANPSALNNNVSVSKSTANIGDVVTFTAQDVEGYDFTGWTLTGATVVDTSLKEITVTVDTKNISATANYTVKSFNIKQSATLTNGSISVNANANYGEDVTFTITPNSGYQVVNDSVEVRKADGKTVTVTAGGNGTYTFKMPASNVIISANFELAKYTITKPTTTDFTVTVDDDLAEATVGTKVSFTVAKAHEYAVLDKVTVTDASDKQVSLTKDGDKYTFTMPASNVTINVTSSTSSTGYGLVGSLNNWNTGANVFVKDSSSTSNYSYTTVDLTAGTYEFKVAHGVDWYTKANTTITSSSCTDIQFEINSSKDANCKITVTEAGTYKFVWNENTKKISVIYPNAKYYVVGRFMTSTYETSNWNPKDTNMPFTYDSETGYYKLETGKTINDLSGVQTNTSSDAYYYFWLYDGGSYYQPSTSNTEFHNNDSSNKQNLVYTSNDNSQTLRFSNTSSTNTSPVTLWYDPVERQIWYEALSPVASVTLSAENKDYHYGDSVNLTANVTDLKSNNPTYTFTEVDKNGNAFGSAKEETTNTATFTDLTRGTHYYKVTVSAKGYKSVTATTSITVDVVEKSKYVVKFGVSDKTNGSITATAGSKSITSGASIAEGTQVTFTAKAKVGYVISGWYSDSSYKNKIEDVDTSATTYTTTISKTTYVYVKIIEDPGTLTNYRLYYGSNNESNPSNWNDYVPVYKKANGELVASIPNSLFVEHHKHFFALFKGDKSVGTMQWNDQSYTVDRKSSNTEYVTVDTQSNYGGYNNFASFYFQKVDGLLGLNIVMADPSESQTVGSYVVTPIVKTVPKGALEVYAKDGTLNTTSSYGETTVSGMNADCEGFEVDKGTYKQYAAMPGDRLTVTTVVNDTQAKQGWYVSNYVINGVGYDAISTVKALAAVQAGSTGASYTIAIPYSVTGKETKKIIEITPIYKNRNIEAANDYITLYANADSLGDRWGNTISVYSYYYKEGKKNENTDKAMNSAYPGEPMMKTSSGLYVAYVPKNAWGVENGKFKKLLDYEVSGITFNNYKEGEEIHQKTLTTDQNKNFQTYDYDDFKYIAAAGYDTVLFDFQYRKAENSNQKTLVENSTTEKDMKGSTIDVDTYKDTTAHNGWDLLTNMDGEEVSILGYTAKTVPEGQTFNSTDKLHIVSVGNMYDENMGEWSTVWYVYDNSGNYVTQGHPSDFIPRYTKDADGKQVESDTQTTAYLAIKNKKYEYTGAYITYENEMGTDTAQSKGSGIRSDGRWYYSRAVEQVNVNTHVLYAGADKKNWKEDTYSSDNAGVTTGAKALVGTERTTKVDRNTEVGITASALGTVTDPVQYKFIGWTTDVTKDSGGNLTVKENPSMTASSQTIKVSSNIDLYALYIPVATGDLVISHEAYTGPGAFGGAGRYFVQATLYDATDTDKVIGRYYQEGSVTIPNYTENSGKIDVQLIVYSVNGSKYKATYNYNLDKITDESHVDKVCSSGNPAVVAKSFTASQIFEKGVMKTNKVAYYSDLQTNNITVKMNYYNRKVENGKPADMDSNPTSYSYIFTSYPKEVLNNDGTLSIPTLIEYAKNHSQQPDNMIETYVSWNSQEAAKTGITSYMNYHTNVKYVATPYHTDQYGNVPETPSKKWEKWVTYYDRNGVEVAEDKASAETVSSISIWYFNTPKKYTYTLNTANSSSESELGNNGDGTYYGKVPQIASELFYNTRLFTSDREVSDASSPYTEHYGVKQGYTGQAIDTAETIEKDGTPLKFLYWAYDTAGKKVASTNIQYGLRITNNTTLYAIYGKNEITAPGLTVQEVTPDTFFDSNNISKTRINTIFNPYNCKDNDKNIDSASVVYLRVSNATTEKSLNNLDDADLQKLRKQISTVVSKASYEKFKSGDVDAEASQQIVNISGSTASGFKFKVVDAPSSSSTQLQTSLSNKNRGQFTTTFKTSTLKNYTYYVFATMGYKNYNGTAGITYITSDNFVKYKFDENGKYVAPSNS